MRKYTEALSTVPGTWGGFNIHKLKKDKKEYMLSLVSFLHWWKQREREKLPKGFKINIREERPSQHWKSRCRWTVSGMENDHSALLGEKQLIINSTFNRIPILGGKKKRKTILCIFHNEHELFYNWNKPCILFIADICRLLDVQHHPNSL